MTFWKVNLQKAQLAITHSTVKSLHLKWCFLSCKLHTDTLALSAKCFTSHKLSFQRFVDTTARYHRQLLETRQSSLIVDCWHDLFGHGFWARWENEVKFTRVENPVYSKREGRLLASALLCRCSPHLSPWNSQWKLGHRHVHIIFPIIYITWLVGLRYVVKHLPHSFTVDKETTQMEIRSTPGERLALSDHHTRRPLHRNA